MNILQWAAWGAYLTSMGTYLASVGLGAKIGIFYAMQGIVSIFMPTLMGIVPHTDRSDGPHTASPEWCAPWEHSCSKAGCRKYRRPRKK